MFRLKAFYAVPGWARLLTAGAATVVAACLPLLAGSASNFQILFVAAAGVFSASIAIFGRPPRPRQA